MVTPQEYAHWVLEPTLPAAPTQPRQSYFVCGTPRSGSWLLCGLLASTDVAGRPHEYFWCDTESAACCAWGVSAFGDYLESVLAAGTTTNGVFGAKLTWAYAADFFKRVRSLAGEQVRRDPDALAAMFPRPQFVFLRRDDVVAQAVSWARAIQTGYWHGWDSPSTVEPRFDFDQVDALVGELKEQDRGWRTWFGANDIQPLEVRFEDLTEEPHGVVRSVLGFLGNELDTDVPVAIQTAPTGSDGLNVAWAKRYRLLRDEAQRRPP
jgi:LPS sulfotransferase NodH